jgi:hypothetical protein
MTLRRTLATASATLLLLASLTACFGGGLPTTGGNQGGGTTTEEFDLTGTSWSGTDSDGDFWGFEFQSDGTVGLTYNEDTYDDPADTWKVNGGALTITTVFDQGDVVFTGPVDESSMNLNGTYPGGTFTVTVTQ